SERSNLEAQAQTFSSRRRRRYIIPPTIATIARKPSSEFDEPDTGPAALQEQPPAAALEGGSPRSSATLLATLPAASRTSTSTSRLASISAVASGPSFAHSLNSPSGSRKRYSSS